MRVSIAAFPAMVPPGNVKAPVKMVPVSAVDDDEDEACGRILTEKEYAERLRSRPDIFSMAGENRLKYLEIGCLALAVIVGSLMSTGVIQVTITDIPEFLPVGMKEQTVRMVTLDKEQILPQVEQPKPQPEPVRTQRRQTMNPDHSQLHSRSAGQRNAGGDPTSRIYRQGILGMLTGQIAGRNVVSGSVLDPGGCASQIEAILSGVNSLHRGTSTGVGRRGITGIGIGPGYTSGIHGDGDGTGGIESLLPPPPAPVALRHTTHQTLTISDPIFENSHGQAINGARTKTDILRTINQNMNVLRYVYTLRLKQIPDLHGKVTVKFAIDEFGNVAFCEVRESTMHDEQLEKSIVDKIQRWKFNKIDKPGDITEVVFPFVFSF